MLKIDDSECLRFYAKDSECQMLKIPDIHNAKYSIKDSRNSEC